MKIEQKKFSKEKGWETLKKNTFDADLCNFVMAFGSVELLRDASIYESIRKSYPNADIVMGSTAGEIFNTEVNDGTLSLTAIYFEKTKIKAIAIQVEQIENSGEAGRFIASAFEAVNLKNILIISDGQKVNGSSLIEGINEHFPKGVVITGGLAGSGTEFSTTYVGLNEAPVAGRIVAIGFYSDNLTITCGSIGGWDSFGPERLITKSKGNILYELDGKPALDIYKMYLGEYAHELPRSGLTFPLSIRTSVDDDSIVRTLLDVNEEDKSLTFAGNMPEGKYAKLMKANFDRLIEGAHTAALNSVGEGKKKPELALLISCMGRKFILRQRVEEEVEAVKDVFGENTALTGFYSHGEISLKSNFVDCEFYNQTMTITTFSED